MYNGSTCDRTNNTMMSSDWPVSAQEAAARLFAHALPTARAAQRQKPAPPHANAQPHRKYKNQNHHHHAQLIEASWWPVVQQEPESPPSNCNESSNGNDPDDDSNSSASWTGWIPCFEQRDDNDNDISEPILVGPETPTEVCITYFHKI